jgi:lysophospholipase
MRDFRADHLRAVDQLMSGADEAGLEAPRYLLGHSLGGLIVARWAQLHLGEGQVAGLILMTPFIAPQIHVPGWKRLVAFALSGLMPGFTLPTEIRDKDLFRNPADQAAFASDPLVQRSISAGHWVAMGREQQRLIDTAAELQVPVLLQIAAEDHIADSSATRALGNVLPDVTIVEYAEAFHPLHADPVSGQVFEDLIGWVRRQAA